MGFGRAKEKKCSVKVLRKKDVGEEWNIFGCLRGENMLVLVIQHLEKAKHLKREDAFLLHHSPKVRHPTKDSPFVYPITVTFANLNRDLQY